MSKKKRIGIVISVKSQKTINVQTQIKYQHPKYLKTLIKTKNYMAHNTDVNCHCGDIVLIEECPPKSKRKAWELKKILKKYNN
jgi:small subunit ribosomal protein S17